MAYSGEDFFQNYRKTFVISPFDDTQVSPVGYDLRIGSAFLLADPISAEEKLKLDSVMKIKSPEGSIGASPATEVQSRLSGVLVIKPAALIIRLFANMVAGHIIILSFISLIFIFGAMAKGAGWGFSPISVLFTVFIYFIELLVAFIQAFIFTNLTAVFIGQAFEGGHDDADGHHEAVII